MYAINHITPDSAPCFFADVMAGGGRRGRKPARRRFGPGGKLMRGDAAL
jgi:hypothetical protein